MADQNIRFGGDGSSLIEALKQMHTRLVTWQNALDRATSATAKFDNAGKVVEATIKSLNEAGDEINQVFKLITVNAETGAKGFRDISTTAKSAKQDIRELAKEQERLARSQQARNAAVTRFFGDTPVNTTGATPAEVINLSKARDTLRALAVETGTSTTVIRKMWEEISTGNIQVYQGHLREIFKLVNDLYKAHQNVGQAARDASEQATAAVNKEIAAQVKLAAELLRQRQARNFISSTAITGPGLPGTASEFIALGKAETALIDFVAANKIATADINRIWQELATGNIRSYQGELNKLQKLLLDLMKAQQLVGQTSRKELDRQAQQARELAAQQAQQATEGQIGTGLFGNISSFNKFTAQQKISIIDAINNLAKFAAAHNLTAQQINQVWNAVASGNIQKYTGALQRVQANIVRLQTVIDNFNKGLDEQGRTLNEITISWQSFVRVFAFTIARGFFFQIADQIRDSVKAFAELDTAIAGFRTIDNLNTNVETLRESLIKLSDAWGIDIIDQARGAYEALSNQIGEGVEAIQFLNQANALAVTTFSSVEEAVDALSSVINAYGLNNTQAQVAASGFFRAIDLGRFQLEDVSDTIGRVLAPAAKLGISFSEINAALTVMTRSGVTINNAMTFLRNIIQKLIRPTDDMKELFAELGVESGDAAIATFGFAGLLEKLSEITRGSATEIANLFHDIRAINGQLFLSGNGFNEYANDLTRLEQASINFSDATDIVLESASKKFQLEINKIRNYLINDWGRTIVTSVVEVSETLEQATGGAITFANAMKGVNNLIKFAIIPAITALIFSLRGLDRVLALSPTAKLFVTLSLVAEAFIYLANVGERSLNRIEDNLADLRTKFDEELRKIEVRQAESLNVIRRTLRDQNNIYDQELARTISIFNNAVSEQEQALKDLDKAVLASTENISRNISEAAQQYEESYNDLRNTIIGLQTDISDTLRESDQKLFQLGLEGLSGDEAANLIFDRIEALRQLRVEAARGGQTAIFEDLSKEIIDLLEQQKKLRESDLNIGIDSNDVGRQYVDIRREVTLLTAEELELQKQLIEVLRQKAEEEALRARQAKLEEASLDRLIERFKEFDITQITQGDSPGQINSVLNSQIGIIEQLIDYANEAGVDISEFVAEISDLTTLTQNRLDQLSFQNLQNEVNGIQTSLQDTIGSLEDAIAKNNQSLRTTVDIFQRLRQLSTQVPLIDPNAGAFDVNRSIGPDIRTQLDKLINALQTGGEIDEENIAILTSLLKDASFIAPVDEIRAGIGRKGIQEFIQANVEALQTLKTVEQFDKLIENQRSTLARLQSQVIGTTQIQTLEYQKQVEVLVNINAELGKYADLQQRLRNLQSGIPLPGSIQPQPLAPVPQIAPPSGLNLQPIPQIPNQNFDIDITIESVNDPNYDVVALGNALRAEIRRGNLLPLPTERNRN